jgi:hypothetical protein
MVLYLNRASTAGKLLENGFAHVEGLLGGPCFCKYRDRVDSAIVAHTSATATGSPVDVTRPVRPQRVPREYIDRSGGVRSNLHGPASAIPTAGLSVILKCPLVSAPAVLCLPRSAVLSNSETSLPK